VERGFDLAHVEKMRLKFNIMGANAVGAQAVRLEGVVSGCPMPSVRAMILFANDRWCSPSGPERVAADLLPANSGFGNNRK
jgi:hypothetical protein